MCVMCTCFEWMKMEADLTADNSPFTATGPHGKSSPSGMQLRAFAFYEL